MACHGKFFTYGNTPEFTNIGHTYVICDADGKNERSYACTPTGMQAGHSIQSHDGAMVAADGDDYISLIDFDEAEGACAFRPVAAHRSSMKSNFVHPHPSFSNDDRYIVFGSDFSGKDRGNIYLVDLHSKK